MMLLIFSYEITKKQRRFIYSRKLPQQSRPDRVLAVTCMTLYFLSGHELQCFSSAVGLGVGVGAGEERAAGVARRKGSQCGVSVCVSM